MRIRTYSDPAPEGLMRLGRRSRCTDRQGLKRALDSWLFQLTMRCESKSSPASWNSSECSKRLTNPRETDKAVSEPAAMLSSVDMISERHHSWSPPSVVRSTGRNALSKAWFSVPTLNYSVLRNLPQSDGEPTASQIFLNLCSSSNENDITCLTVCSCNFEMEMLMHRASSI